MSKRSVSYWTLWTRNVVADWVQAHSEMIGGVGLVVEIDETLVCGKKCSRVVRNQRWVIGGCVRGSDEIFMESITNRTAEDLKSVIIKRIRPGTIIVSDCWRGYEGLEEEGFFHYRVNHRIEFVRYDLDNPHHINIHTNHIERAWRDLKGYIPRFGVKPVYYDAHLAVFLFKRKVRREDLLEEFFAHIRAIFYNENQG